MAVARKSPTLVFGSRGGVGMGSKSGLAHALGCPEWVPPGAGSGESVLGTLWWFPCPSGPILAIHADTDQMCTHTYRYIQYLHIHTFWRQQNTYGGNILKDTNRFQQIHTDTCIFLLQKKYPLILSYTYNTYQIPT
jgi:hypothetical protein